MVGFAACGGMVRRRSVPSNRGVDSRRSQSQPIPASASATNASQLQVQALRGELGGGELSAGGFLGGLGWIGVERTKGLTVGEGLEVSVAVGEGVGVAVGVGLVVGEGVNVGLAVGGGVGEAVARAKSFQTVTVPCPFRCTCQIPG